MRDKNSNLNFTSDQDGATAIEYALIAALLAVTMIVSVGRVGETTKNKLENTAAYLGDSDSGADGAGNGGGSSGSGDSGNSGDGASGGHSSGSGDNANGGSDSGKKKKKKKRKKKKKKRKK